MTITSHKIYVINILSRDIQEGHQNIDKNIII